MASGWISLLILNFISTNFFYRCEQLQRTYMTAALASGADRNTTGAGVYISGCGPIAACMPLKMGVKFHRKNGCPTVESWCHICATFSNGGKTSDFCIGQVRTQFNYKTRSPLSLVTTRLSSENIEHAPSALCHWSARIWHAPVFSNF